MTSSHGQWDFPPAGRYGQVELLEVNGNDTSGVFLVPNPSLVNISSTEGPDRSGNSELGLDILRETILEP